LSVLFKNVLYNQSCKLLVIYIAKYPSPKKLEWQYLSIDLIIVNIRDGYEALETSNGVTKKPTGRRLSRPSP